MERNLLFLSFALGGVVWLCGFLTVGFGSRGGRLAEPRSPRLWIAAAVVLPVLVFLITLPARPPVFAAGHGLGIGFLVGGLLGLLAVWTIVRASGAADRSEPVSGAAAIAAPAGLALMASAAPPLWMRDSLLDALCGVAIGWLCAVLISMRGLTMERPADDRSRIGVCLSIAATAAVLLCALAALGELHGLIDLVGKSTAIVHWDAPALAFVSCMAVLLLIALLPAQLALRIPLLPLVTGWIERGRDSNEARASARRTWRMAFCGVATLIVGRMVGARFAEEGDALWKTKSPLLKGLFGLLGPNPMFHVIALGVVAAILIGWLVRDHYRQAAPPGGPGSFRQTNVLAVLTLAAAAMLAFQMMGGFGLGLLLTVLLLFAGLTGASSLADLHELGEGETSGRAPVAGWTADTHYSAYAAGRETLIFATAAQSARLLMMGALLLLYRLITVRFETEMHGVGLSDHYALFGILFGALLPPVITGYLARTDYRGPAVGAVKGGAPAATAGQGARLFRLAVTGLLVLALPTIVITLWGAKCALALVIGLALSTVFEGSLLSGLLAIAAALALTQWIHHVLPLAQLTRDQKVTFLFWTTAITMAALLLAEYAGRRRNSADHGAAASAEGGVQ